MMRMMMIVQVQWQAVKAIIRNSRKEIRLGNYEDASVSEKLWLC